MSGSRKRDTREYERRRYDAKKQRKIEKNRERMERYYMDKEDINIVAAALEDKEFDLLSQHALVYHNMSRGYENVYRGYMGQTKVISSLRHMTETRFSPLYPLESVRTSMVPPYLCTPCLLCVPVIEFVVVVTCSYG